MKKFLAVICVVTLMLTSFIPTFAASDLPYPDVSENAVYAEAVLELYDYGIMQGDTAGNFNPNKTVTREEFATIICRLLDEEENALAIKTSPFNDVASNRWSAGYIARAAELGIINGYGNGKFGPEDPVTVAQAAKMLVCAWGYGDNAVEAGGWPDGYVSIAEDLGILNGVKSGTSESAKRWEVAMMAYQTLMNPFEYEQGGYADEE